MAGYDLVPRDRGYNYTGILTRSIVFSGALLAFLAGTDYMTVARFTPSVQERTNKDSSNCFDLSIHHNS